MSHFIQVATNYTLSGVNNITSTIINFAGDSKFNTAFTRASRIQSHPYDQTGRRHLNGVA